MVLLAATASAADERVDRLPEQYRTWLEQEVVYIITPIERDIFLDLTTVEERDRFIESFWARRDPDPATLENEFKVEHYERFEYANRILGRDSTRPGWKTDRGRYYIILGKPLEIQRYDGYNEVVSTEIWYYMGDPASGLPARFNLTFYKDQDIGEYELYDPLGDGPDALLRDSSQLYQVNQHRAVDVLESVSMDLARASLTIDLTELSYSFLAARNTMDPLELFVRPAMNVQRVLADIETSPLRRVDTHDLEGHRKFGHKVTADYSFRFFESRSNFVVLYGPDNTPFLHYAFEIEPSDFTLETDDSGTRHYTTLEVEVEVRDEEGRIVAYDVNQPLLQLSQSEFERAKSFPLAYRNNLPVIPGKYDVSVILKNRATRDYTAAEVEVDIPSFEAGKPMLSDIVLGYDRGEELTERTISHRTFQLAGAEIQPTVGNTFTLSATALAMVQALDADAGHSVKFQVLAEAETIEEVSAEITRGVALEEIPLLGLESGYYTLRAQLLDSAGNVLDTREAPLTLSPRNEVARPAFVYRKSFNVDIPGFLEMTLGNQLMATGRVEEAEALFEKAVAYDNPALPMARWRLASIVLFSQKADRALELLTPLEADYPNEYEVVEGLAFAYYIKGDYNKARGYFERSAKIRVPDTTALNALGDCYERLGDTEKASELYRRSLELNPDQQGVQARLAGLSGAP